MNSVYEKLSNALPQPTKKRNDSNAKKLGAYNRTPSKRLGVYNSQNVRKLGVYN